MLTVLFLLRREANSPSLKGTFKILMPDGFRTNLYNYRIVRLWREDPDWYLTAGVNLVPLVPLASVPAKAPGDGASDGCADQHRAGAAGVHALDGDVSADGPALFGRGGFAITGRSAPR